MLSRKLTVSALVAGLAIVVSASAADHVADAVLTANDAAISGSFDGDLMFRPDPVGNISPRSYEGRVEVQTLPAPGAVALLGLAAISGRRRRR